MMEKERSLWYALHEPLSAWRARRARERAALKTPPHRPGPQLDVEATRAAYRARLAAATQAAAPADVERLCGVGTFWSIRKFDGITTRPQAEQAVPWWVKELWAHITSWARGHGRQPPAGVISHAQLMVPSLQTARTASAGGVPGASTRTSSTGAVREAQRARGQCRRPGIETRCRHYRVLSSPSAAASERRMRHPPGSPWSDILPKASIRPRAIGSFRDRSGRFDV